MTPYGTSPSGAANTMPSFRREGPSRNASLSTRIISSGRAGHCWRSTAKQTAGAETRLTPPIGKDPNNPAQAHLRRSIIETQELVTTQIRSVHEAFDAAVRSYREIDDL